MDSKAPLKRKVTYVVYSAILIVSIITMMSGIRFFLMEDHGQIEKSVATNIGDIQSSFKKDAGTVLKDFGQEIIRLKAEKVAKDIENYLIRHPRATIKDMQNDLQFNPLAIQPVGKTGYTAVHEANTAINRFHINPKIVNTTLGAMARDLPDFWEIVVASREGENAGGYYKWREADGSVREKYMWVATVSRPTADGILLDVAATTYIDEFMQPLARLSEKLHAESAAASVKVGSLSENNLNRALVAITIIILVFLGVVGFMAFRLIQGYHRIEREVKEREEAAAALHESEQRLSNVIQGFPISAFVIGKDHRVIYWNNALEKMSGIKADDVIGTREHWKAFYRSERPCMADLVVDETLDISQWYPGTLSKASLLEGAYETTDFFPDLGVEGRWLRFTAAAIRNTDGDIVGSIETLEDMTDRIFAERNLQESEEKYRSLINNLNVGIYRSAAEQQGRFIQANPSVARIFGYNSVDEFMQVWVKDLYQDPGERKKFMDTISQTGTVTGMELRLKRKDGKPFHASVTARANCNEIGDIRWIDGVIEDITDRKRMEEEILTLAVTDQLTGLYNRRGFIALSEQQLRIAERTESRLLLLFADLDGMKWINDNLGHLKGDEALIGVADILKKVFREADIVARVGGDEFAVLALGTSAEYPEILKDRLQQQIDLYNRREKRDYQLSLSVGIVDSDPKGNVSIDDLMSRADERMYENKKGKSHESASRPG
jgi:diguanylate cyclase (GGDEF)-like protein/PAS domain S-box-containing protein